MKKVLFAISFIIVIFIAIMSFDFYKVNTTASVDRKTYLADNEEEVGKMYIETNSGNIKNKYTKESPLILTTNETMTFHMAFSAEDYPTQKLLAESAVYMSSDGTVPSNILTRTMNDGWYDQFNGIRFAFRAVSVGDCKVVIRNKNTNEIYESLYVKVVPANTIQFTDPLTHNVLTNPGYVTVDTGAELVFQAVLLGNLNMDGNLPNTQNYVGSGFWSWDVPVTNEWTPLENGKWLTTYRITTQGAGQFTVGLGRNGNGQVGSITVKVEHNKIEVDNISVGTISYNHINKNIATKMMNGFNKGDNTSSNRYAVYVGETIKLNAPVGEDYSFALSNDSTMSVEKESSFSDGLLSVTFKGTHPGNNEVLLKNGNGDVVETFYVQVHYPIYVETFIGEIGKDYVHEYLEDALANFYYSHPDAVVSSPSGVPQYVKNGWDYYMYYYLIGDNTVTISTYVNQDDASDFSFEGNLERVSYETEDINSGEKAGYKKITAEYKVIVAESGGLVRIGDDTFLIAQRSLGERIHHFDVETTDGGVFTMTETINYNDGYSVVEKTVYSTKITNIHGSKVYDSEDNLLVDIPEQEYWVFNNENNTQFESTSAYITNEDRHLIDSNGNVIDDLFIAGRVKPQPINRNVLLLDIDRVDFDVDIDLIPTSRTKTIYKKNKDGEKEFVSKEDVKVDPSKIEQVKDCILSMNHTQIVDAYNKCPFHSGLDFTIKVLSHKDTYLNKSINGKVLENPNTGNMSFRLILLVLLGFSIYAFTVFRKGKNYNK